jgi:tRNA(fMet)-specific endonuclease VapC
VEEQMRAWLAQVRRIRDVEHQVYPYDRLIHLIAILGEWEISRWSVPASEHFNTLRSARIRIGTQDLKIASIALAFDATLLSANLRDFGQVPELQIENWL